jgi:N6-L-threonylcarbamoyladenine synthase
MSDRPAGVILGVESSCDETACAVVAEGRDVLANVVASQIEVHQRYGGVVPELASRAHIEAVNTVIAQAMQAAGIDRNDLAAVAVTHEPGLIGSLLVGLMAAKTLAWVAGKPLIGVNHVAAHAYAACLDADPIDYPAVALIASGGHTALYNAASPTEMSLLGNTIDDAAGEAFDKVAQLLALGYPGGPVIDKTARNGDPHAVDFPRTLLKGQSLDFSFSGIKTAVLYHVRGLPGQPQRDISDLSEQHVADVAASFQQAVVDTLRIKIRRAVQQTGAKTVVLGGGVAANGQLRQAVSKLAEKENFAVRIPPMKYCTDNAAMIAGLAWHDLQAGRVDALDLAATPTVRR